jgi:hypothetical protein
MGLYGTMGRVGRMAFGWYNNCWMEEQSNSEVTARQGERKNQKNIYVHKIKSLMRISQDSLLHDDKEISCALNK